ncbi:hypothetical protein [Spirosoma arcticum]
MKTNQRIDEEIEQTLRSLDGIERAAPKPFFLTRVQARLDRRTTPKPLTAWVFRPAYVVASLGLVLLLNLSAVVYVRDQVVQHEQEQESAGFSTEWELESDALNW